MDDGYDQISFCDVWGNEVEDKGDEEVKGRRWRGKHGGISGSGVDKGSANRCSLDVQNYM